MSGNGLRRPCDTPVVRHVEERREAARAAHPTGRRTDERHAIGGTSHRKCTMRGLPVAGVIST